VERNGWGAKHCFRWFVIRGRLSKRRDEIPGRESAFSFATESEQLKRTSLCDFWGTHWWINSKSK
jgi:hypothetical protein